MKFSDLLSEDLPSKRNGSTFDEDDLFRESPVYDDFEEGAEDDWTSFDDDIDNDNDDLFRESFDDNDMDELSDMLGDDDDDDDESLEDEMRAMVDVNDIAGTDDIESEELTPEEEREADNMMQVAATTELIKNEMNAQERAEFANSELDTAIAINEGFLLDSDVEELKSGYLEPYTESKIYAKTKVQFNKDARMNQLHSVAVNVCAQAKGDKDYVKLKKINRIRRILKAKLAKRYDAVANRVAKTYFQRLRNSKSPTLKNMGKKVKENK